MKGKIALLFLVLLALFSTGQQTLFRRIFNTTGTIPDYTNNQVAGAISSGSGNTLLYTGSANIPALFPQSQVTNGSLWIFLPSSTSVPLSKVVSYVQTAPGAYTFTVDRSVPGQTGDSVYKILSNVYGYSIVNDSTVDGQLNNVRFKAGVSLSVPYSSIAGTRTSLQDPVYVNATGTTFFITEIH